MTILSQKIKISRICLVFLFKYLYFRENRFSRQSPQHSNRRLPPNCALCKQAGRQNTAHYMSKCNFLPESDKKYMSMTRQIKGLLNDCNESEEEDDNYDT